MSGFEDFGESEVSGESKNFVTSIVNWVFISDGFFWFENLRDKEQTRLFGETQSEGLVPTCFRMYPPEDAVGVGAIVEKFFQIRSNSILTKDSLNQISNFTHPCFLPKFGPPCKVLLTVCCISRFSFCAVLLY